MVAIFTRNCQPRSGTAGTMIRCWFFREALLAAGWSENSNDGDPNWASATNLVLSIAAGVNGLSVSALYPREVYSPNGDFLDTHVGLILNLDATNDQNRGLWRISEYIDANTVKVDPVGWFTQGWATESGMAARLTTGDGGNLSNGAWSLMDSPAGYNVQVRIYFQDVSHCYVYVRPRGKLADPTEMASVDLGSYYDSIMRINLYVDGLNFMMVFPCKNTSSGLLRIGALAIGALEDVDPADTDPIFLLSNSVSLQSNKLYGVSIAMLDSALAGIAAYTMPVKRALGQDPDNANVDLYNIFNRRLLGSAGLAALRSPWVCLDNIASTGACVRGRLPVFRMTYTGFEQFTPLDAAGAWQHVAQGIAIPRNGPTDPLLAWPEA